MLEKKACYAAFKAHDVRFDGRLFIGVASTGVYCRPVCRVRTPREENCSFHPSAAAAEAAGYRPCRKCRPELAPGLAPVDAPTRLSRLAAIRLEGDCLSDGGLAELAKNLGVTDRHLRRVFSREFGVSPVRYIQTRRLLLAKSLLTDAGLSATGAAFAAGFGSVRRFNDLFKKRYRMSPTALRNQGSGTSSPGRDGVTLYLGYRPPYDWDGLLSFLQRRAIPGVETADGGVYRRTAVIHQGKVPCYGWIAVEPAEKGNTLAVTIAPGLLPVLPRVLASVKNLFDLACDPLEIHETLKTMNAFKPGICRPGVRLPGCFNAFEMAVRAVLGQQITVKAARTLAARVAQMFGAAVSTPFAELTRAFPTPETICGLGEPVAPHFKPLGVIGSRARSIHALAEAMRGGDITLSPAVDPELERRKLLALPGFGPWTVEYLAMRALGWPDAFPHTDLGVRKAMDNRTPAEILECAGQWRPWRAYAAINLWNSL